MGSVIVAIVSFLVMWKTDTIFDGVALFVFVFSTSYAIDSFWRSAKEQIATSVAEKIAERD